MTPDTIRNLSCNGGVEYGKWAMLREIAAQLAELNQHAAKLVAAAEAKTQ